MYKNVLNQYTIGLILWFSSSFIANAQIKGENAGINYANPDLRSEHPPAAIAAAPKSTKTATLWQPVRLSLGYTFGDFYYDAHAGAPDRGSETNYKVLSTYHHAFQFRCVYLNCGHEITKKFAAGMLPASGPDTNTIVSGITNVSNGQNHAHLLFHFWKVT